MSMTQISSDTSQAAIFARLWETKSGRLPKTVARQLVKLGFSADDRARMHELADKNQQAVISKPELEELDNYIVAGEMLAILQSKARKVLRGTKSNSRHG